MLGDAQLFFQQVAEAPNERAIALLVMDAGPKLTGAHAVGYCSLSSTFEAVDVHARCMQEAFLDDYEKEGRAIDPLLRSVRELHVPAEGDLPEIKRLSPEYAEFMGERNPTGLKQYMLAPLVSSAHMTGMVYFASRRDERFGVAPASAMSLHVSARIAVLRALDALPLSQVWDGSLSKREQEIAGLAVRGLSTVQMARAAGISANTIKKHLKRLYEKLGVSSRAELATWLLRGPSVLTQASRWAPSRTVNGVKIYAY